MCHWACWRGTAGGPLVALGAASVVCAASGPTPFGSQTWRVEPVGLAKTAPVSGAIETIRQDVASGVWTVTLSNGIVAHHRQMEGRVELAMTLSGGVLRGQSLDPESLRGAIAAMREPVTSKHSSAAMKKLLSEANVRVAARAAVDSLVLQMSAPPEKAELLFELAYAIMQDGQVENAGFDRWRAWKFQSLSEERGLISAALERAVGRAIVNDELKAFGTVDATRLEELTIERVGEVLRHIGATCSVEVGIAGDLQRGRALEYAAKYLGAISARDPVMEISVAPEPQAVFSKTKLSGLDGRGMLVGVFGPNEFDLNDVRALRLASDVLEQRLKAIIPDGEIVARYEPRSSSDGRGMFYGVVIDSSVDGVGVIRAEIERMASEGVTDEELGEASRERSRHGRESLQRPGYWAAVLSDLTRLGLKIEDIRRASYGYRSIEACDLRDVLLRCVSKHREIVVQVGPEN